MNIRDFRYVLAVADERHFGRAAQKCHISQPALSGQIRKLEDHLGVALFERSNRRVRVTPIGEQIVVLARQLIDMVNRIEATAAAARDPLSGPLRLGMIPTIGPYLSPLILPAIRQHLPNLALTLIEGFTHHLERRLREGELDIAILATEPGDKNLEDRGLYIEPFQVALPIGHRLAQSTKIDTADLKSSEMLLLSEGHCLRDQILDACHAKTTDETPNTRETSLETILALVAAGDGMTMAPNLALPAGDAIRGIACRETSAHVSRQVRLVYRSTFPRPELVDRLATIIRDHLPPNRVIPIG
ncbi:MAG: LysR family transcriptional regulator [Alphaproteobacteria bacterium]|nr:LysR family transcriptional regulator [Alphaproteobacteria bacterium]